jgi:hypothetical protein
LKTIGDVTGQVKGAVKVAQAVKGRVAGAAGDDSYGAGVSRPWQPSYPPGPMHADDSTWPARRGAAPGSRDGPAWPPLPSDSNRP